MYSRLTFSSETLLKSSALFTLYHIPVSVGQLLDLFESVPYLQGVDLCLVIPTIGITRTSNNMRINGDGLSLVLLDHLLIPVDVKLEARGGLVSSPIGELLQLH